MWYVETVFSSRQTVIQKPWNTRICIKDKENMTSWWQRLLSLSVQCIDGSLNAHFTSLYVHVYMQGPLTLTTYQDWSIHIQSVCIPPVCPLQERHLHRCVNDLPLSLCGCQVGGIFALDVPSNHLPCRLLEPCRLITGEGEIRVVCHLWNIKSLVAA